MITQPKVSGRGLHGGSGGEPTTSAFKLASDWYCMVSKLLIEVRRYEKLK